MRVANVRYILYLCSLKEFKVKSLQVMKKILMLVFVAVAVSLPSQAQVKFGLKGGLNLTNLSMSESIGNNLKNKEGTPSPSILML